MSLIASHPTGNANVRQAMVALADAGLLEEFHTTIAVFKDSLSGRISSLPGLGELRRRSYEEALRPFTRTHPWRECVRLASLRLGWSNLTKHERGWVCMDRVYHEIDDRAAQALKRLRPIGVYSYEDGASATFKAAKKFDAKCFYDLPIGYWRTAHRILREEAERRPDWAITLSGLRDSPAKLARKDEELRLADHIVVASTFTKQTLQECPFRVAPVSVVPYGADDALRSELRGSAGSSSESLKVLFVGGLSQRKGIADLFEAVESLKAHAKLTVIGRKPAEQCAVLDAALGKHRWIESLPREKILEEMRSHDVLVFPSLFEGFGLVVTEALSQGLPVITTPHTCGPDILENGIDGFIVPIRSPDAIAEKLERLASDRTLLAEMSQAALNKAHIMSWSNYQRHIVAIVMGFIKFPA